MNPGGLRADLLFASSGAGDPDGNVTFREAANVQPFANSLFTMELTGAQLRSVLEEQWQPDGATRPFLKLGLSAGLEYTYDPTAPRGERISTITLNGSTVTDAQTIRIVTNSFLASGGDGFTTLAQAEPRRLGPYRPASVRRLLRGVLADRPRRRPALDRGQPRHFG